MTTFKQTAIEAAETRRLKEEAEQAASKRAREIIASEKAEKMKEAFAKAFGFDCEAAIIPNRERAELFIPAILLPETSDVFFTLYQNGWQVLNLHDDGTASVAGDIEPVQRIADFAEFYEL